MHSATRPCPGSLPHSFEDRDHVRRHAESLESVLHRLGARCGQIERLGRRLLWIGASAAVTWAPAAPDPAASRPFLMGFTAFPPDISLEAVESTRRFVAAHGDLIAHHIEGVPWVEAARGEPFSKQLLQEHESKRSMRPKGAQVYLAVSPGRGELKLPDKGAAPLPADWKGKAYDDPEVKRAYLNYCRRAIDYFRPDSLAIGIEVNEIHDAGAERWRAYTELHKHVYRALKLEHPRLPIFASFTLHNLFKKQGEMLKAWEELMPYNDWVAVSYYPFLMGEPPERALDWMTATFDRFQKPFAVVETNEAAERLPLPKAGVVIDGSPGKQAAYLQHLLQLAERRQFRFVVLFIHQDYDALWEKIKANAPELFMAWRDCGLLDEQGRKRPAYDVWQSYFRRPLQPNP